MAYREVSTTYGNKTTSEIAAGLPSPRVGDTVFNTDYAEVEWWNGSVWLSNNSVQMTAAVTVVEGNTVYINASGQAALMTNVNAVYRLGVGVVQYGGVAGSIISVRTCGVAKVLTGTTAGMTIGQNAQPSGTAGRSISNTTSTQGTFGRCLATAPLNSLAYVLLTFIDRQ